jgi:hypothetical protein
MAENWLSLLRKHCRVPYDPVTEAAMTSMLYHQGNRVFQDEFGSRRLADRLEERSRTAFTDDDKVFIESCIYFFMATADASGHPDCSFKGGAPGFVRVTGPSEIAFPDYDGNGMFKSIGNLAVNPHVGCCSLQCMVPRSDCVSTATPGSIVMTHCSPTRSARS